MRIVIDTGRLPVAPALQGHPRLRDAQLLGGEDYQLVFTADPSHREAILALATTHGVRASRAGWVEPADPPGRAAGAVTTQGPMPGPGFAHFEPGAAPSGRSGVSE